MLKIFRRALRIDGPKLQRLDSDEGAVFPIAYLSDNAWLKPIASFGTGNMIEG